MRVLLPLRKVPANNHDNNSGLSDAEEGDEPANVEAVTTHSKPVCEALLGSARDPLVAARGTQHPFLHAEGNEATPGSIHSPVLEQTEARKSDWDEAGLRTSLVASLKEVPARKGAVQNRKRRASIETNDWSKACKKRAALDRKPPARDLGGMAGGSRRAYAYRNVNDHPNVPDDDLGADPLENNPASARGDPLNDDETIDFALALKKRGLEIRVQEGDGNCLFRAVSLQVYGDPSMHNDVRQQCLDFMMNSASRYAQERDKEHFAQFVTGEPFDRYILRKRQNGVHGNNPEIQAISELFNRPVEVFCPDNGAVPLNIFHAEYKTADAPIRLSYHDGNHYNAVVDPLVPTAGLGLGLPGLQPGLADKMQVARAVTESDAVADQMEFKRALKESEDDELQRAIKESKLSAEHMHSNEALALSDMDATYFELEQAALERSLQSYSSSEHGKKQKASSGRRRKHGRSSPGYSSSGEYAAFPEQSAATVNQNAVASLPSSSCNSAEASIPPVAAAASVASVPAALPPAAAKRDDSPAVGVVDEYPQAVQELVMNGFPLNKVTHAYEIIGDNFDNLLAFLMSNSS